MYRKVSEIWMEEFNAINSSYHINKFILEDAHSCIYELKDGRVMLIDTQDNTMTQLGQINDVIEWIKETLIECGNEGLSDEEHELLDMIKEERGN